MHIFGQTPKGDTQVWSNVRGEGDLVYVKPEILHPHSNNDFWALARVKPQIIHLHYIMISEQWPEWNPKSFTSTPVMISEHWLVWNPKSSTHTHTHTHMRAHTHTCAHTHTHTHTHIHYIGYIWNLFADLSTIGYLELETGWWCSVSIEQFVLKTFFKYHVSSLKMARI